MELPASNTVTRDRERPRATIGMMDFDWSPAVGLRPNQKTRISIAYDCIMQFIHIRICIVFFTRLRPPRWIGSGGRAPACGDRPVPRTALPTAAMATPARSGQARLSLDARLDRKSTRLNS